jgi:hypothetical protein
VPKLATAPLVGENGSLTLSPSLRRPAAVLLKPADATHNRSLKWSFELLPYMLVRSKHSIDTNIHQNTRTNARAFSHNFTHTRHTSAHKHPHTPRSHHVHVHAHVYANVNTNTKMKMKMKMYTHAHARAHTHTHTHTHTLTHACADGHGATWDTHRLAHSQTPTFTRRSNSTVAIRVENKESSDENQPLACRSCICSNGLKKITTSAYIG